jgi:hypothetical protein
MSGSYRSSSTVSTGNGAGGRPDRG